MNSIDGWATGILLGRAAGEVPGLPFEFKPLVGLTPEKPK